MNRLHNAAVAAAGSSPTPKVIDPLLIMAQRQNRNARLAKLRIRPLSPKPNASDRRVRAWELQLGPTQIPAPHSELHHRKAGTNEKLIIDFARSRSSTIFWSRRVAPFSDPMPVCQLPAETGEAPKLKDVMTSGVKVLRREEQLTLADDLMNLGRIRHLPVLDEDGKRVVGVVTQRDLFRGALAQAIGYDERARRKLLQTFL